MARWANAWGDEFETIEEALYDVHKRMSDTDFHMYLEYLISFTSLLDWAMKQDSFWERFNSEVSKAEEDYFHDNYNEIEDEEKDDEPDCPDDVEGICKEDK